MIRIYYLRYYIQIILHSYFFYYFMFRSFAKIFNPRAFGLLGAFFCIQTSPYWMTQEEKEIINQKLKKKLNEKFHNRKDISF